MYTLRNLKIRLTKLYCAKYLNISAQYQIIHSFPVIFKIKTLYRFLYQILSHFNGKSYE